MTIKEFVKEYFAAPEDDFAALVSLDVILELYQKKIRGYVENPLQAMDELRTELKNEGIIFADNNYMCEVADGCLYNLISEI